MEKLDVHNELSKSKPEIKLTWLTKHVETIISCILTGTSIVVGMLSAKATSYSAFIPYFISLLVFQILLIIFWGIVIIIKIMTGKEVEKVQKEKKSLELKIEKLNKTQKEKETELERERQLMRKRIDSISTCIKNMSKHSNELSIRITDASYRSYHTMELVKNNKELTREELINELENALSQHVIDLFEVYKRYSTNLLTEVINLETAYINLCGYEKRVSAAIKLFDRPYIDDSVDVKSVIVYTAFRDKKTFEDGNREIGEAKYSIDKNADFLQCLKRDDYRKNNIRKTDDSYMNEHVDFDRYYNCTIVAPIRTRLPDNRYKFFGYLCCDCKNTENDTSEIFDRQAAQLLFSAAQQYATFLEMLQANWEERITDLDVEIESILEVICIQTKKWD